MTVLQWNPATLSLTTHIQAVWPRNAAGLAIMLALLEPRAARIPNHVTSGIKLALIESNSGSNSSAFFNFPCAATVGSLLQSFHLHNFHLFIAFTNCFFLIHCLFFSNGVHRVDFWDCGKDNLYCLVIQLCLFTRSLPITTSWRVW